MWCHPAALRSSSSATAVRKSSSVSSPRAHMYWWLDQARATGSRSSTTSFMAGLTAQISGIDSWW